MATSQQSDLIILLRLMHDDLSIDEGHAIRIRLADSLEFARRYRQLRSGLLPHASAAEAIQHWDQTPPDLITEFLEDSLSESARREFERQCWESPNLLREVASGWKAIRTAQFTSTTNAENNGDARDKVHDRLHELVMTHITSDRPRHQQTQPSTEDQIALLQTDERPPTRRPERGQRRRFRLSSPLVVTTSLTAAVALALLVAAFRSPINSDRNDVVHDKNEHTQDNTASDSTEDKQLEELQGSGNTAERIIAEESNEHRNAEDRSTTAAHNDPQVAVITDPPASPDRLSGSSTAPLNPAPPQRIPDNDASILPEESIRYIAAINAWEKIAGVIGFRERPDSRWQGVQSSGATASLSNSQEDHIRTMIHSRAETELNSGGRLIIGPDTSLRLIGTRIPDNPDRPSLTMDYGRICLLNMPKHSVVQLVLPGREFVVQSQSDRTTFSVEQSADDFMLAVWRGTVDVDRYRASRNQWLRLSAEDMDIFRSPGDPSPWYREADLARIIPRELTRSLNTSNDLFKEARNIQADGPEGIQIFATYALIDFAPSSSPESMAVRQLEKLADSPRESRRQACVRWLLASASRGHEESVGVWRDFCQRISLTTANQQQVGAWFHDASAGKPPTAERLKRLLSGLGDREHVFVRQTAKFFLQRITGDPLQEYDPLRPNQRDARSAVTRKVRAWHTLQSAL